ncbi:hypothetical protein ACPPVO_24795 [Dactylosporangium sp. McL0621]|uniref:MmyB family transcriptional regulator n=1 Tax=Dactylosporangium sp. McL0621 TaxID=3415678 RepID=UPI003CFA3FDE
MDRELPAHFLRAHRQEAGAPDDHAAPVMTRIVERLSDHPAMVFSRFGEVLLQTRPAVALFGDCARLGGASRYLVQRWLTHPAARLGRYRHAELGELELYRQLLVDPVERQLLLVFMAIPGSPSDEKLRLLAAAGD